MTQKVQSVFLVAVLVMSVFVGLSMILLPEVQAELNPPHDDGSGNGDTTGGDGIYATDGDWVIEPVDTLIYSSTLGHETIIVNGHLIIQPGGSLTLENVTLQMNCGFNGEFNITVESNGTQGGTLFIKDLDGDPQTNGDASVITSYTPDGSHRFGFMVLGPHGDLRMNNSELHECGWYSTPGLNYQDAGLWIGSSDITIEGNYISDCHNGITVFGGSVSNVVVKNNNISYCEQNGTMVKQATNIRISGNEYYENVEGVNVETSANVIVENNVIDRNQRMACVFTGVDFIEFNNNTIMNLLGWFSWTFVAIYFGDYSSEIKVDNNTLSNCPWSGITANQYSGLASFTNNTFDDFSRGSAFAAARGDNAYFYRNSAGTNKIATGTDDTVSYWQGPLKGYGYIIECEGYNNEQWTFSNWGSGASLWGVETVILRDNIFSDNDLGGAYLIDCGNNSVDIRGNTLENNGYHTGELRMQL
jgi:parallel beta-helix repeat protein